MTIQKNVSKTCLSLVFIGPGKARWASRYSFNQVLIGGSGANPMCVGAEGVQTVKGDYGGIGKVVKPRSNRT